MRWGAVYNGSMDLQTVRILNTMTSEFYRTCADSFSSTRRGAWAGWVRALEGPAGQVFAGADAVSVLDVACGNLRFERFLEERYPACDLRVHAVDNCAPLVGAQAQPFQELDILDALLAGTLDTALAGPLSNLVVCFGFMHHVPGRENRVQLLRTLMNRVKSGGYAVVSFWQFLNSTELARRAEVAHTRGLRVLAAAGGDAAQLEPGDYLLGWQDVSDAFRYCHSFAPDEALALAVEAGFADQVVDHFEADGRTRNLNAYLVLRG